MGSVFSDQLRPKHLLWFPGHWILVVLIYSQLYQWLPIKVLWNIFTSKTHQLTQLALQVCNRKYHNQLYHKIHITRDLISTKVRVASDCQLTLRMKISFHQQLWDYSMTARLHLQKVFTLLLRVLLQPLKCWDSQWLSLDNGYRFKPPWDFQSWPIQNQVLLPEIVLPIVYCNAQDSKTSLQASLKKCVTP